jgi:hypothetical protein
LDEHVAHLSSHSSCSMRPIAMPFC